MKLSIITVNLNNKEGLQKTCESTISQAFTDFEWISGIWQFLKVGFSQLNRRMTQFITPEKLRYKTTALSTTRFGLMLRRFGDNFNVYKHITIG